MRSFEMPNLNTVEKSNHAGEEPEYKNQQIMTTSSGDRVIIMNYDKEKGLYHVSKIDSPNTVSPIFKINPDELIKSDEESEE